MGSSQAASALPPDEPSGGGRLRQLLSFAGASGAGGLDLRIHERMRLGILSALAVNDALDFTELRKLLQATDGNLSVHARKLEEAGYVSCEKGFRGRTPRTRFRITPAGRKALKRYLEHMEALIRAVRRE